MPYYRKFLMCGLILALLMLCLSACSSGNTFSTSTTPAPSNAAPTATPTPRQASLLPFTPPTKCQPPSPISTKLPEVRGTTPNAELWALLFPTSGLPIKAKQEIKIVWRMTGSGDIHLRAYNPDGKSVNPVWGPEEHGGSSWNRPGAEWGTGFNFPTPGCWNVHVERTNVSGDVWFNVA
ncbi:hypothetical protein [Ktedonobacter racemifer]|uniref:DUF2914 domain-containing protein n=1 Tax=Ktedonobacter racemifer DSM 44963 TaxID=485913 RepID=D6TK14_KTERA|nr:hypothetical protein [Ktedonobacter racemifer]EFH89771.1 hypothetical protein Krac_11339 [Ktedonobacter racemifer DSM 44963]